MPSSLGLESTTSFGNPFNLVTLYALCATFCRSIQAWSQGLRTPRVKLTGRSAGEILEPNQGPRAPNREAESRHAQSNLEHDPGGSVVARVFRSANPSVYAAVHESVTYRGRKQEMIQPHAFV